VSNSSHEHLHVSVSHESSHVSTSARQRFFWIAGICAAMSLACRGEGSARVKEEIQQRSDSAAFRGSSVGAV
jgi:hypothetical protein